LGEQALLHGLVHSRDVCDEPVADGQELYFGNQGLAVVVAGEGLGVERFCQILRPCWSAAPVAWDVMIYMRVRRRPLSLLPGRWLGG
jgi:hypothetical protein